MQIPFYFYLNALAFLIWGIYRRRLPRELDIIGYYLVFSLAFEVGAWVYSYVTYRSNHWIYNVYTTLQVMFLGYIYYKELQSNRARNIIRVFTIVYPVIVILNFAFIQSFFKFHTYTYLLGCFFLIHLIFRYYNKLMHTSEIITLRKTPFFWFNLGNMIYFIGSIFYMGSINFIIEKDLDRYGELITIFVYSFTSVQYGCFIVALLCNLAPKTN